MAIEDFYRFDLSVYSLILLIFVLVIFFIKKDIHTFESRIFRGIVYLTMWVVIFEVLSWIWDGAAGDSAFFLNYLFNTLFSIIPTAVTCMWASYIDYKMFGDVKRITKRLFYSFPLMLVLVLVFLNSFFPVIFSISSLNVYQREPFMWLSYLANIALYIYIVILIMKNRGLVKPNLIFGVIVILTLPALGAGLQMVFYGILLIGPIQVLQIVIVYIVLETIGVRRDYLTQLSSRSMTDEYITKLIKKVKPFVVVMIDLDDFKKLNDEHGHNEGDKALIYFSQALLKVFSQDAMVARYGGDEFVVVQEYSDSYDIEIIRNEIYEELNILSVEHDILKELKFSIGLSEYVSEKSLENLLVESDNEMYRDKANNKNRKRRKEDL